MLKCSDIKNMALSEGFDLVGLTMPRDFATNRIAFEGWIARGAAEPLEYMQRYMDVRFNPAHLMEGTRSAVVCAINYKQPLSTQQRDSAQPKIASYALCTDYHKVIRRSLRKLLRSLQQLYPHLEGRCCVDTAPLLEKQLAVEAGLGWIGRQSLLITPQFGSFVLLGVLLLSDEIDLYDSPLQGVGCGECRRCIEQCPAGAILENRMIDSRLCISSLTVEQDEVGDKKLHGWLFGCDECQIGCPYNRNTPMATNSAIAPIAAPPSTDEWLAMSPDEFATKLSPTPIKRAGLERLQRNVTKLR